MNKHSNKLISELERLVESSKKGDFDIVLSEDSLYNEDKEIIRLLNEVNRNYKAATDYDLMKYKLTCDALNIALWDTNITGKDPFNPNIKFSWSQEFRDMLGFTDEIDFPNVLSSWSNTIHPDEKDSVFAAVAVHLDNRTGNTPYDIECRLMMKDGHYRHFRTFGTSQRDSEGVPLRVSGALMDITEKKQIEEALKHAKEQAEQNSQAKSTFLARMSHEIRTPLNAVIGMTNMAMNTDDSAKIKNCLKKADNASRHLLEVINDILDISKIEANKFELLNNGFNLDVMLNKIIMVANVRAEAKNQNLEVHFSTNVPLSIYGDELRLSQVITNLLSNAVKFSPEYGIISLNIEKIDEAGDDITLKMEVADSGIGISKEQQKHLFNSFVQADSSISMRFGGTGLGLAISKCIIEMMGGCIWIESELGKGARFIFTVKVKKLKEKPEFNFDSPNLSLDDQNNLDLSEYTILAAEDNEINREILAATLETTGVSIDFAETGKIAVSMFSENPLKYCLIFMDIQMPEMNGYEAARTIRALNISRAKDIPIIAMTANVFREDIENCLSSGMNDHIGKPIDIGTIYGKLRNYIR
ncbi:MAG: ATP-binding protein [Treponema sp.]|nr:ATP-binding protein [Treponema sp.]